MNDKQLLYELRKWLRDPQNDCLRARGDIRWREVVHLEGLLMQDVLLAGLREDIERVAAMKKGK